MRKTALRSRRTKRPSKSSKMDRTTPTRRSRRSRRTSHGSTGSTASGRRGPHRRASRARRRRSTSRRRGFLIKSDLRATPFATRTSQCTRTRSLGRCCRSRTKPALTPQVCRRECSLMRERVRLSSAASQLLTATRSSSTRTRKANRSNRSAYRPIKMVCWIPAKAVFSLTRAKSA